MFRGVKQWADGFSANIQGWRTNRKIVVIESDDWGSVRMPSRGVYESLLSKGIRVDKCPYNRLDCLENREDLTALFEVLTSVKDIKGNHAILTANMNVANPDFERIERDGFDGYYYRSFTESYKQYQGDAGAFSLICDGIRSKIYHPQFHGREHVNVGLWLEELKNPQNTHVREAFNHGVFGLSFVTSPQISTPYMASFIYRNEEEKMMVAESIREGLAIFKSFFGFSSDSLIAPLYCWTSDLEYLFKDFGVKYVQGMRVRKEYEGENMHFSKFARKTGKDKNGLIQLVRNARFEPSITQYNDETSYCLRDIDLAFGMKKPAIISSHRVNFIGQLEKKNRERNLKSLKMLLQAIVKRWPNVEFMHSVELGKLMSNAE